MKLHFIYMSIGISTLVLNLALTLHIIRKRRGTELRDTCGCEDIMTFRLTGENSSEGNTTEAILYDDTVVLK